jgi:hypothetical protein
MLTLLGAFLFNQLKQMQHSGGNLPAWGVVENHCSTTTKPMLPAGRNVGRFFQNYRDKKTKYWQNFVFFS